jgi:hypothetical protein
VKKLVQFGKQTLYIYVSFDTAINAMKRERISYESTYLR